MEGVREMKDEEVKVTEGENRHRRSEEIRNKRERM